MLFLQLKSGEYLTIGEDITVQVFQDTGSRIQVGVKAPRDFAILRGEVRERLGEGRPEGLIGQVSAAIPARNEGKPQELS